MISSISAMYLSRGRRRESHLGQRVSPPQAGESGVVSVRGNPFGAGFDRKGRKIGIAYEVALCSRGPAQPRKNFPMARTWRNNDSSLVVSQLLREIEGKINGGRFGINLRVGYDPDHSSQRQLRKPANFFGIKCVL